MPDVDWLLCFVVLIVCFVVLIVCFVVLIVCFVVHIVCQVDVIAYSLVYNNIYNFVRL